jgi:membrane-associated phospholipid phosphatase
LTLTEFLALDERLSNKLRIIETDHALKPLAVIFAHSGDSWLWLAVLLLIVFWGDPYWQYRALVMACSFILLAVVVLAIKFTVRRKRPEGEWGQMYRATDPHSFPSGHAARAFIFATLAIGLGPTWLAVILAIWAPLVSLARVGTGVHYLSDVIAGTLAGIIAGVIALAMLPILNPLLLWFLSII